MFVGRGVAVGSRAGSGTAVFVGRGAAVGSCAGSGTAVSAGGGGAVGSLVGSYNSSYAYPGTHLVEINGLDGRVLIEDTVRRFSMQNKGSETREVWEAGYFNDADREFHRTFDKHFDALIDAFRSGGEPPVHARAGRRALKLALAAVRAFEEHRTVQIRDEGFA